MAATEMITAATSKSDYQMFEILPNLYLSRFPQEIPSRITHILNMCREPHPLDTSRIYLHIPIDDIDDITPHISSIIKFIDTALQDNAIILVHCALGINRSVAATIVYLCYKEGINADQALRLVKERKGDVRPSQLFLRQIDRWFGREIVEGDGREDPLKGFHRRLEERKRGSQRSGERMDGY